MINRTKSKQGQPIPQLFEAPFKKSSLLKTDNRMIRTQHRKQKQKTQPEFPSQETNSENKLLLFGQKAKARQGSSRIRKGQQKTQRSETTNHDIELQQYLINFKKKFKQNYKLNCSTYGFTQKISQTEQKQDEFLSPQHGKNDKKLEQQKFKIQYIKTQPPQQTLGNYYKKQNNSNNIKARAQYIRIESITRGNPNQDLNKYLKVFRQINQNKKDKVCQLLKKGIRLPKINALSFNFKRSNFNSNNENSINNKNKDKIASKIETQTKIQQAVQQVNDSKKYMQPRNSVKLSTKTHEQLIEHVRQIQRKTQNNQRYFQKQGNTVNN